MAGRPSRARRPALAILDGGAGGGALADLEAEAGLLGLVLVDLAAIGTAAASGLSPEHFSREANGKMYAAAAALSRADPPVPISQVTLAAELEARGVLERCGGRAHLAELAEIGRDEPTSLLVKDYARRLIECAGRRREFEAARALTERHGYRVIRPGMDAPELLAEAEEVDPLLVGTFPIEGSNEYRYRPAKGDDPGAVVQVARQGPRPCLPWAPRVEAVHPVRNGDDEVVDHLYRVVLDGQREEIRASELRTGEVWDRVSATGTAERRVREALFNIVRQQAKRAPGRVVAVVTRTGWHRVEDGPAYVHADGRTWPPEAPLQLRGMDGRTAKAARPPASMPEAAELRRVLASLPEDGHIVRERAAGVPLLLFGSGIRSLASTFAAPQTSVVLEARSSSAKSGLSLFHRGVSLNVAYPPVPTAGLTSDTATIAELLIAAETDMPVLGDDLALQPDATASEVAQATALFDRMLRPAANDVPIRRRATRKLEQAPSSRIRTVPVYTAENLPPRLAESALRRALVLTWEPGDVHARECELRSCRHADPPGADPCLRGFLEDCWPAMRRAGELVIELLGEWAREDPELPPERVGRLDQVWAKRLARMVATAPRASEAARRAAPLLAGLELAEQVAGLDSGTLTGPASAALVPHLVRQGQRIKDRSLAADDLAAVVGSVITRALLDRRAHVLTASGSCDATAVVELAGRLGVEPQELGYRESRGGDPGDPAGVPFYAWPEPDGLAVRAEGLYELLRATKDPRFDGLQRRPLVDLLLERGVLLRSGQKGQAASWRLPAPPGGDKSHKARVVVVRRELVFPGDDDDSPRARTHTHEDNPADPADPTDPTDPGRAHSSSEVEQQGANHGPIGGPWPTDHTDPGDPSRAESPRCPSCHDPDGKGYEPFGGGRRRCLACGTEWGPEGPQGPDRAENGRADPGSKDPVKTAPRVEARSNDAEARGARVGVVGPDGLLLPGGEELLTFDVGRLEHAGELADVVRGRGLVQAWVHPSAHKALGLPTVPPESEAQGVTLRELPWLRRAAAAGYRLEGHDLSPGWVTVYPRGQGPGDRSGWVEVYFPAYGDRLRTLRPAVDAGELLAGLELLDRLTSRRFRRSPGAWFFELAKLGSAGARTPLPKRLEDTHGLPDGERVRPGLYVATDAERALPWLHAFDVNRQFLAATTGLELGMGELAELPAGELAELGELLARDRAAFRKRVRRSPGYYRATVRPPAGGLPAPAPFGVDGKPHEYTHVGLELLAELGCEIELSGALAWPNRRRWMVAVHTRLTDAWQAAAGAEGQPGAGLALATLKAAYREGIGWLASEARAQSRGYTDAGYRPEWRAAVIGLAFANLHRHVARAAAATGRRPLMTAVDMVAYACAEEDPAAAAAALGLPLSEQAGKFKPAGRLPMARFLALAEQRGGRARLAILRALDAEED